MGALDELRAKMSTSKPAAGGAAGGGGGGGGGPTASASAAAPGNGDPSTTPASATPAAPEKTAFAKRNPVLEKYVPDVLENALDAVLPDRLEAKLDRGAERAEARVAAYKRAFDQGIGEIAGVLLEVGAYAASKFKLRDLLFGIYHLAEHHRQTDARDALRGLPVTSPATLAALLRGAEVATWAYCPSRESLVRDAGLAEEDILMFDPTTELRRPAHLLLRDRASPGRLIWAFRGTTDLNDIILDAAATTARYCGGHAHWGMIESARWFARERLPEVRRLLDAHGCTRLQLVGHSLGAGTAALLAHVARNDPDARRLLRGIDVTAFGIATPAVLSADLADGCKDYVTSVVLLHDIVPRFGIHSVFRMKDEMDATNWGDALAAKAADWMVPDAIEGSATWQRLQRGTARGAGRARAGVAALLAALAAWLLALLRRAGLARPEGPEARAARERGRAVQAAVARARQAQQQAQADGKEVVPVYAPGKLYFVDRRDPPKEEMERLRAQQQAARDAAKRARDEKKKAPLAPPSSSSSGLRGRRTDAASPSDVAGTSSAAAAAAAAPSTPESGDDDDDDDGGDGGVRRAVEQARHADHARAGDLPDVDFYPGATFTMIEGAPGERFRRIVLRDTCLSDHLTGGMLQACRALLAEANRDKAREAAAAAGGLAARGPSRSGGSQTSPAERIRSIFRRGSGAVEA